MERLKDSEYESMIASMLKACGAKIAYKDESKIMKIIGKIVWLFNKRFMTDYVNVIGHTIWFPSRKQYDACEKRWLCTFMTHECHHVQSTNSLGIPLMVMVYGFPQSVALLLLPVLIASICVNGMASVASLVLLGLLLFCLLPLPAYFRVREEVEAEKEEEAVAKELGVSTDREILIRNVCSLEYYNPWFPKNVARRMFGDDAKVDVGKGTDGNPTDD